MRVSKIVKEYIAKKVYEKYNPIINEISLDYKCEQEKLRKKLESLVKEFEEKAQAIIADNCSKYNFKATGYENKVMPNWYEARDREAERANWNEEDKIRKIRDEKINEIIINLELGGTKEDLDKMLSEL